MKDGVKTATSSLVWEEEHDGIRATQVGELGIVTNSKEEPLCVIEVIETVVRPFNEVDEQFAYHYGEGDRTLSYWRDDLWEYYSEICTRIRKEPAMNMPLNCNRFRLLYTKS